MTPQELKNSILQLAIQGKLVEQRPEEGTAFEYKNRIIKSIGSNKAEIPDDEKTIDIPDSWEWAKLSELTIDSTLNDGNWVLSKDMVSSGSVKLIQLGSIGNCEYKNKGFKYLTEQHFRELNGRQIFGGYMLINRLIGDRMLICILPEISGILMTAVDVCWIAPNKQAYNLKYLMYALSSGDFQDKVKALGRGTTRFRISKTNLINISFPLPPRAEQDRIVAKIEELLPLIDRYEKAWSRLEEFNKRFPDDMQKSILQMAIQGKLVEQRPEEGTAAELLSTVVINDSVDGQRVKQKVITDITEEEIAFDIPATWTWVKLGTVCTIARGGSPRPIKDFITTDNDGVNWIKIGDTEKNGKYINATAEKIKPSGVSKSRMVHAGDFLLTNSMSFGRPYILKINGCIHDGWLVISQSAVVFDPDYMYWMLSSAYAYSQFCEKVSGAVVKNLNSEKVANSVFPLPPLAEQKRIVARLEELLPLCDKLK